ncbi:MAG TPA: molecular chaperone DnaJ, partial [Acidimicrobiia bacterium]|nr:molecular chaperone DnaJ [Acidimicrobiia bacterium]
MNTDFYAVLGVARTATDDEIKKAYRRLAREHHPDANPDDASSEERFKEVQLAYEVLRDPERRERYDRYGVDGFRNAGPDDQFGFGQMGNIGDLFEAFFGSGIFGGTTSGRGVRRGNDAETAIELDFAEAVFGAQRDVRVRLAVPCATCGASGAAPGTSPTTCSTCGGVGEVRRVRQSILGQMVTASPCPRCGGTGQEIASPCPDCRGEGRRTEERSYTVDVPAGVDHGNTLRLSGRGHAGGHGAPAGDLFVHVRVRPHAVFRRDGLNLIDDLHIAMTQAALGTTLVYETLDTTEELVIPHGTQSGKLITLKGRGVPRVDGRGRGDIIVHLIVDTPADLSREQDELLRQLAVQRGEEVSEPRHGLFSRFRSA